MKNKLYCGAGSRVINPWKEITDRLPGYSDTILDDQLVRAIALGDGTDRYILLCFDSGVPNPQTLYEKIEGETGVPSENVLIFTYPNHSKVSCVWEGAIRENPRKRFHLYKDWPKPMQEAMEEYGAFVTEEAMLAVKEALANMRPAKVGHAAGTSYVNVCRNQRFDIEQPDGAVIEHYATGFETNYQDIDRTLFVMKFVEADTEKPIAFFINYPMSCQVTMSNNCGKDGKIAITGDVGGNCCHYMEEKFPGSVAIWSCGPAGNINPIMSTQLVYADPMTGRPTRIFPESPEVGLIMLKMVATRHFADIMRVERQIDHCTEKTSLASVVEWSETPGYDEKNEIHEGLYKVRMQALRINDVMLMGISGPVYGSLAEKMRQASPFKNTYFITPNAAIIANSEYLLDDWVFEHSAPVEERMNLGPRDFPHNNNDANAERVVKFDGKIDDCITGTEHSQIVPGYLADSLYRHTLSMAETLL